MKRDRTEEIECTTHLGSIFNILIQIFVLLEIVHYKFIDKKIAKFGE